MTFISILILLISLLLINKDKINLFLFSFFCFIYFIISDVYIISNYFTGKGIDESFIYHISYGIEGAGFTSDINIIIVGLILFISSFVVPALIYRYLQKDSKNKFRHSIAIFFIIIAFILHPFTKNILELNGYFINDDKNTEIISSPQIKKSLEEEKQLIKDITFKDLYKIPENQKSTENNKNIVFIYLESFEKLYLDNELFPGLSNGLNKLKEESIFFNNIDQAYGTSWTIAGMVGSQCGIPLINSGGGGNSMHGIESFLPGAFCMGDFLKNAGYDLSYIGGSELSFAGKGNFYKTHGFNTVKGINELIKEISNKEYKYDWGLYDDTLFDLVYDEYEKLSKGEKKFGLFMLNLDTHGRKGVVSEKCSNNKYIDKKNSILNSYNCVDNLLSGFINKIRNNKNFKNTTIVIVSDHYAMSHNNSIDILKKKEKNRKILFMIIDKYKKIVNKEGSTLDIGATVLSQIGFKVDQLGLGINLLSSSKTILKQGKNINLKKMKNDFASFWDYPSMLNGFSININNKEINLSQKKISFPAIMHLDNNLEVENILWEDIHNPIKLYKMIPKNKNSIYINYCENKKLICISYIRKDGIKIVDKVFDKEIIHIDYIKNIFKN